MAEKVPELAPEGMVMFAGTVTEALLLESAMTAAPEAGLFKLTEQLDIPPLAIVDGLQLTEVTCAGAVTFTLVCADPL